MTRDELAQVLADQFPGDYATRTSSTKRLPNDGAHRVADAILAALAARQDGVRSETIEECARLLEQWANDAREFAPESKRCEIQMNICQSAANAIRRLGRHEQ